VRHVHPRIRMALTLVIAVLTACGSPSSVETTPSTKVTTTTFDEAERIEAVRAWNAVALYKAVESYLAVLRWNDALKANEAREQAERRAREAAAVKAQPPWTAAVSPHVASVGDWGLVQRGIHLFYGEPILWTTPCAIPAYICDAESLGWVNIKNKRSSASGKYQFLDSTWNTASVRAGYPEWSGRPAGTVPEGVQDVVAAHWLSITSCAQWVTC